jgi:predicted AlkP superfamily pyrophosphatase or phosphodiesterase
MCGFRSVLRVALLWLLALWPAAAQRGPAVLLISIDSLMPDYVLQADRYRLHIPNLRRLAEEGTYATGVKGVVPTVTYPSHTTILSGVSPARHGIHSNHPFDPLGKNLDGWYWYTEDVKVPTLWDIASAAGLLAVNVDWPVSVGARAAFNIPQVWRAGTEDDRKLIRALSTPLLRDLEQELGPYAEGSNEDVAGDERRARFAVRLLELKKPNFMTVYFTGLDTEQHKSGPFSPESVAVLERIDALVGLLRAAAERASGGRAVICVVSDHGMVRTDKSVNLVSAFRSAGLMTLDDDGKVKAWSAAPWSNGGSAAIMLREPADRGTLLTVRRLLDRLAGDPSSGVLRVLDNGALRAMGGFPEAAFLVDLKPGYRIGGSGQGPLVSAAKPAGTHGYLPSLAQMNACFFLAGPGIPRRALGEIDMRSIAPTLARLLGLQIPTAEGRDLRAPD